MYTAVWLWLLFEVLIECVIVCLIHSVVYATYVCAVFVCIVVSWVLCIVVLPTWLMMCCMQRLCVMCSCLFYSCGLFLHCPIASLEIACDVVWWVSAVSFPVRCIYGQSASSGIACNVVLLIFYIWPTCVAYLPFLVLDSPLSFCACSMVVFLYAPIALLLPFSDMVSCCCARVF